MKRLKLQFENFIIILFIIISFIKILSLNYTIKMNQYSNIYTIMGVMGSVLILTSILSFFEGKGKILALIMLNLAVTLVVFSDAVYNRYFLDLTSIALLHQARIAGEVKDSIGALLKITDFKYFADVLIAFILYFIYSSKLKGEDGRPFRDRAVMGSLVLIMGIIFSGISIYKLDKDQPNILQTFYDKKFIATRIGSINFHAYDIYRYASTNVLKKEKISDDQKTSIRKWIEGNQSNKGDKFKGIMKGKNLIVVQLEAFQGFVLNRSLNGQEITPNLNKLAKVSLAFSNYYYQTSWGGTSDAEFLSNVSLYPAREGSVYYQYSGNTYDSLVSGLKNNGYITSVMHSNRPGFWNRTNMYSTLGFDSYHSEKDFIQDDIQGLGLSDKSFFKQSVDKMKANDGPFYSFLISLSSHFPYKDQNDKIKDILDVGEFEGTAMGDYLKAVRYTDEAIGIFIDELKKEGLWDNSVVVFYGDHSAIPYDNRNLLGKLVYGREEITELEWFNQQKVVAMMHFPGEEIKGAVDKPAGQIDLYPTLANLFGLEAKYALGKDILNTEENLVIIRTGNWVYNNSVYLKGVDKIYEASSGKSLEKQGYKNWFEKYDEYLQNSDYIIENNLIKYFKAGN